MSGQQYYPGSTPLTPGKPGTLASDADRDRTVDVLNAAFAEARQALAAAAGLENVDAAWAGRRALWQETGHAPDC